MKAVKEALEAAGTSVEDIKEEIKSKCGDSKKDEIKGCVEPIIDAQDLDDK